MSERKTYRKMLSTDLKGRTTKNEKFDQRKDWGYTNQFRRMMQRRREENSDLTVKS